MTEQQEQSKLALPSRDVIRQSQIPNAAPPRCRVPRSAFF
jgi:hypothetical protein